MRFIHVLITASALVIVSGGVSLAQSGDAKAAAVMAAARKALGGEQRLAALKALSLRGAYRRDMGAPGGGGGAMSISLSGPGPGGPGGGSPQLTGDLEIDVAFPDNYIKVDNGTGMMAITRIDGFEGDRPFSDVSSSQPGMRIFADDPTKDPATRAAALRRSREELARLLLGLIAGTQPSFAVTYTYAGQAESPDGTADVIDVKGPDNFTARLLLDTKSHLPLMLTYTAPEPRMVMRTSRDMGGRPPAAAGHGGAAPAATEPLSPEERERLAKAMTEADSTPLKLIEYRVFFTDFRTVGGLSLPHHITRGTAEKTTEEWEIKSYAVNPTLKADRFKVGS
jgi:hypothetical protein